MRDNQEFLWGLYLKDDLSMINQYYKKLPESEREKGMFALTSRPPLAKESLVSRLWDRLLPGSLSRAETTLPKSKQSDALGKQIREFAEAEPLFDAQVDFDTSAPHFCACKDAFGCEKASGGSLPKTLSIREPNRFYSLSVPMRL
jgi:hypothetical protein